MKTDIPSVQPASRAEWRQWLAQNHRTQGSVWLILAKKDAGIPTLTVEEASEDALCFGWVDSKINKLDAQRYKLLISPRNPKSNWSAVNKARIEKLADQGLMTEAGWEMVQLAKETGTWTALDEVENLVIPPDLGAALQSYPSAESYFLQFPKSAKRGILEWILNAKSPETRAKRIAETARLAADNIRANQYRPK